MSSILHRKEESHVQGFLSCSHFQSWCVVAPRQDLRSSDSRPVLSPTPVAPQQQNHPRSLLKIKMTEGKVCKDVPKPTDSWGEIRKTVCFVSHNFIWLDWFPLRVRCFFNSKTKKINEQMLYIGKGQEVRAPGEWNPTQRDELS